MARRARTLSVWTALTAFALVGIGSIAVAASASDTPAANTQIAPAKVPPGTIGGPPSNRVDADVQAEFDQLLERLGQLRLDGEPLGQLGAPD